MWNHRTQTLLTQDENFSQDDDDDDMDGGFELELANMEMDVERLLGEGPENQQTNVKWVTKRNKLFDILSILTGVYLLLVTSSCSKFEFAT